MADKDPKQNEPIELDVLNKENEELKNNVTKGQKYVMWGMIAISVIAIIVIIYILQCVTRYKGRQRGCVAGRHHPLAGQ